MLQALLHRKWDESIPEPQRREDVLTSAVFGTLVWMEAWELLAQWLGVDPSAIETTERKCWFWPRLSGVEPDVVLQIGRDLIVVEAKLASGRHDLAVVEGNDRPVDQLVRQYECFARSSERRVRHETEMEQAIQDCHLRQVLVVDGRRRLRAIRECKESRELMPPDAQLGPVTWQRLFQLLGAVTPRRAWATELRAYLELIGLSCFEGVTRQATSGVGILLDWHRGQRVAQPIAMSIVEGASAAREISAWRSGRPASQLIPRFRPNAGALLGAESALRAWAGSGRGRSEYGQVRARGFESQVPALAAMAAVVNAWRSRE